MNPLIGRTCKVLRLEVVGYQPAPAGMDPWPINEVREHDGIIMDVTPNVQPMAVGGAMRHVIEGWLALVMVDGGKLMVAKHDELTVT